ncbi:MAG TPA: efflux RND transporter periplasmic adaptor subunit [Vulgatibacter sp.]|nr:efflux RND transporter periplasmic adaptor subunit [Vulgatibacter sp.]
MAALALAAGCPEKKAPGPPPPPPVEVARAESMEVPIEIGAIGTGEAIVTVEIRSQVTAQLESILFEEGQDVEAGDTLFVLDRRSLEEALDAARASLRRNRAQAAFAASEAERYTDLAKKGAVSRLDAESRRTALKSAREAVTADEAAVREAEINLGFAEIAAPIAGKTGSLNVHVGDQIKANDTLAMVSIRQIAPIYVSFSVPGDWLNEIREADEKGELEVIARPRTGAKGAHRGKLTFIDNAVDVATGTILLKGTFPNEDEALWPGQFVDVTLVVGHIPDAVVVPSAAVQTGQQGLYVFVVDREHKADVRPVETGPAFGDRTVIAKGVQAGELVVTDGHLRLQPGIEVEVREPPRAPAP